MFLLAAVLAFAVSAIAVVLLRPFCVRFDHVDRPGGRKRHDIATPLSGGLAITFSVLLLGAGAVPSLQFAGFAFGALVLLILGAMDDRKHVPASMRLALQASAVGVGMYWLGGVRLEDLGAIFGGDNIRLGSFSLIFTLFAAVGVINAVNMIDGMDGLAGGFAALVIAVILTMTVGTSAVNVLLLCLAIGSVLGFLAFNLRMPWQHQARIFLGDAGSLVLGFILVWFAVQASQGATSVIRPITVVWLFGLPLMDTGYLMSSRLMRGASPLAADRYHFHHLLQRYGLTPGWALYAWLAVAALFMAIGIVGQHVLVSDAVMCGAFLAAFAFYCVAMNALWRRRLRSNGAGRRVRRLGGS